MALDDRGAREGHRRMARRERAALAGGTIASHRDFDPIGQGPSDDVGAQQIEAEMRHLVGVRARLGLHRIAPDEIHPERGATLYPGIADVLARLQDRLEGIGFLQFAVDLVVPRIDECGRASADAEYHPRALAARKRHEVAAGVAHQRAEAGVFRLRRRRLRPLEEEWCRLEEGRRARRSRDRRRWTWRLRRAGDRFLAG